MPQAPEAGPSVRGLGLGLRLGAVLAPVPISRGGATQPRSLRSRGVEGYRDADGPVVGDLCCVVEVPYGDVAGALEKEGGEKQMVDGRVLCAPVVLPVLRRVVPPGRVPLWGWEGAGDLMQGNLRPHSGALPGVPPQDGKHPGRGAVGVRVGHAVAKVVQVPQENDVVPLRCRLEEVVAHHGGLALPLLATRRVGGSRDEVRAQDCKLHTSHVKVGPEVLGHARGAPPVPFRDWGPVTH